MCPNYPCEINSSRSFVLVPKKTGKIFYCNFIGNSEFYAGILRTNKPTGRRKTKHTLSQGTALVHCWRRLYLQSQLANAYWHLSYELRLILIWPSESRRGASRLVGLYSATVRQPTATHQRRTRLHVGRLPGDEASVHFGPGVKIKPYSL